MTRRRAVRERRRRRRRDRAVLVVTVTTGVAMVATGGWILTHLADPATPVAPAALDLAAANGADPVSADAAAARAVAGRPDVSDGSGITPIATVDARLVAATAPNVDGPAWVTIDSIGVTTPVAAVGVDLRGEVAVPGDVTQAGWYRFGPAPGSAAGSAVVVAHVDYDGRPGPFFRLADVRSGDTVSVTTAGGTVLRYVVTQTGGYRKDQLPTAELFRTDGPPRLVLITCGGVFRSAQRSYADNVVVLAEPVA